MPPPPATEPDPTPARDRPGGVPARRRTAAVRALRRREAVLARRITERLGALDWYAALPPDTRAWVGLVVQAALGAFAGWLVDPEAAVTVPLDVFAAAPRDVAREVSLQQTVEILRRAVDVVEDAVAELASSESQTWLRESVLRFSRELAYAAAEVYARRSEERGAWDARLESLLLEGLLAGDPEAALAARAAALGWPVPVPVVPVAADLSSGGPDPGLDAQRGVSAVRRAGRRASVGLLVGLHEGRLLCVVVTADPVRAGSLVAEALEPLVPGGAVVTGPPAAAMPGAGASVRACLSGLRAAPAWPQRPRPVAAEDLLAERALSGDPLARAALVDLAARCAAAGGGLLETLSALVATGGALEPAARQLFVHANTVRYRVAKVTALTGVDVQSPHGMFVLRMALSLAALSPRLEEPSNSEAATLSSP